MQKLISVMSSPNKVVINELARFVHDAFKQTMSNINLIVSSLDMYWYVFALASWELYFLFYFHV